MNRGSSVTALIVIGIVAGVMVWLLATGGPEASAQDPSGDVEISDGPKAPTETDLADVTRGSVTIEDGRAIFEATMVEAPPSAFETETLRWRWEVEENTVPTWIVTANVDVERTASLVATQFDYLSSTVDESLPGRIEVDDRTVRVVIELAEVQDFPESFSWSLTTLLDADRGRTRSAVAEDRVPDAGSLDAAS